MPSFEYKGISGEKNTYADGIIEAINEDANGAINHFIFLNLSKICISNNCATINAVPDPIAILTEIKSVKFVEKKRVNTIPIIKPT